MVKLTDWLPWQYIFNFFFFNFFKILIGAVLVCIAALLAYKIGYHANIFFVFDERFKELETPDGPCRRTRFLSVIHMAYYMHQVPFIMYML